MQTDKILSYITKSKLHNIIEKKQFIYDKSALYCVREKCQGCKYEDSCTFEINSELEETLNKSTRNNVRFGKILNKTDWYLPSIQSEDDLKYVHNVNGRFIPKVPLQTLPKSMKNRLVLSESFKTIYKKVQDIKNVNITDLEEFILYQPENKSYYCIKSSCIDCKYNKDCVSTIEQADRELLYVAIDSASQEPEIVTYLSQEPRYVQIFTNHSLTSIDYLLEPINETFETLLDIDISEDKFYQSFLDWLAFKDKTILYNYSSVYYSNILEINKPELGKAVSSLMDKWQVFKGLVKKGTIKIDLGNT